MINLEEIQKPSKNVHLNQVTGEKENIVIVTKLRETSANLQI